MTDVLIRSAQGDNPRGMEAALGDALAGDPPFGALASDDTASPASRPFWDVLGTWETARLEDHELRYLELRRMFHDDPGIREELRNAIDTARRLCGA